MFGLERNKQHSDPIKRQTTTFRVLKIDLPDARLGLNLACNITKRMVYCQNRLTLWRMTTYDSKWIQ
jgi:hypothetical protein